MSSSLLTLPWCPHPFTLLLLLCIDRILKNIAPLLQWSLCIRVIYMPVNSGPGTMPGNVGWIWINEYMKWQGLEVSCEMGSNKLKFVKYASRRPVIQEWKWKRLASPQNMLKIWGGELVDNIVWVNSVRW